MKKLILSAGLLAVTLNFAPSAFAMHAYRSMVCKSATHQFRYKGNYPVGGYYGIALKNADLDQEGNELLILPNDKEIYGEDEIASAEVVYAERTYAQTSRTKRSNDGCFDHNEWTSRMSIQLKKVSPLAAEKLGLVQGSKLLLSCEESTDYPNPKNCN